MLTATNNVIIESPSGLFSLFKLRWVQGLPHFLLIKAVNTQCRYKYGHSYNALIFVMIRTKDMVHDYDYRRSGLNNI